MALDIQKQNPNWLNWNKVCNNRCVMYNNGCVIYNNGCVIYNNNAYKDYLFYKIYNK
jgi:hypothetical protein